MENNIRSYVSHFKLIKTGAANFSNVGGECVFRIHEDLIMIRSSNGYWKKHRHGDLALSVINNIPLHG
jgi:hypothetical protein